ncbi:YidB family protein [Bradyrhizobium sp. URHC0002]
MSQGMPSMTALLGMVALAGYQNRDKITEMLTGAGSSGPNTGAGQSGLGGILGSLGGLLGGAGSGGAGNLLNNGLNELLDSFKKNGKGDTAQSWIEPGPNKEISPPELKQAIGPDVLAHLEQKTGLSQQELLARLSRELPSAIDKYTPDGRLPGA